jgi:hypothetical protein
MKILVGDFNAKVGREDIFKPTIGNESLHEINNDNGVRVVNFATSKDHTVKGTMFPHRSIHKFSWTSSDGKMHNQFDHILINPRRHSSILDVRSLRAADFDTDHYLLVATYNTQSSHGEVQSQEIEVEGKDRYRVEISNRFTALENRENIKISAKECLGYEKKNRSMKDVQNY